MREKLRIFISYRRLDSDFVDRLEIDLSVRGFDIWLDRRDLAFKGAQLWENELKAAIERSHVCLLVVSQAAIESENVRAEYIYARQIGRPVIALLHQSCPKVPAELLNVEWINFTASKPDHEPLNALLVKLTAIPVTTPSSPPAGVGFKVGVPKEELQDMPDAATKPQDPLSDADLEKLYEDGITAQAENDLERAVVFWQRILDVRHDYSNGSVGRRISDLKHSLQQTRVQQLRRLGESARQHSNWGREIAAWSALLDLVPNDPQALSSRRAAEKHKGFSKTYENANRFFNEGKRQEAVIELNDLWKEAPDYGDPAQLAGPLGLIYPPPPPPPPPEPPKGNQQERSDPTPVPPPTSSFPLTNTQTYAIFMIAGFIIGLPVPLGWGVVIGVPAGWFLARGVNRRRAQKANNR